MFVGRRGGCLCSLLSVALLNGSRNPALLLSALLGRVTALFVNKLLIYFTSVKLLIYFFSLLLSTCVQSMLSKNMCSSNVLQLWKSGLQVCIALLCSENAFTSSCRFLGFFVTYCRIYLLWLKLFFLNECESNSCKNPLVILWWFCHIYNLRTRNNISKIKLPHYLPGFCCFALKWHFLLLLLSSLPVLKTTLN